MKQILKKIYTLLMLLKNIIFRKSIYNLHFISENGENHKKWFYDFKHWGFDHNNLQMVANADTLCELYAKGNDNVTINIIASRKKRKYNPNLYDEFKAITPPKELEWYDRLIWGRDYKLTKTQTSPQNIETMWICPVTLFVLGRYPKFIYIKHT